MQLTLKKLTANNDSKVEANSEANVRNFRQGPELLILIISVYWGCGHVTERRQENVPRLRVCPCPPKERR